VRAVLGVFSAALVPAFAFAGAAGLSGQSALDRSTSNRDMHACALFSAVEIARLTGRREIAHYRQVPSAPGSVPNTSDCGLQGSSLHIHLERLPSIARFTAMRNSLLKSGSVEAVPGIGDDAFFRIDGTGRYEANVRVGHQSVTFTISSEMASSPRVARDLLLPLAKAAAQKLR
jgi:hypothetical protein